MSINAVTNQALSRRSDFPPMGEVPETYRELARSASGAYLTERTNSDKVNTALAVLTTYIPTEILTVYVAVLAALQDPVTRTVLNPWSTFIIFLIVTPAVVWLVFSSKLKTAGKDLPLAPTRWPLWEMFAAMLAYTAWAIALPGSPFAQFTWYSGPISGIIVLVTSTALGLLAPIFQTPLKI